METNFLPMEVHKEFARRQDEENGRQNARIGELEAKIEEIHSLALSMERMSANVEKMAEAIERQGNLIEKQTSRIDKMEKSPAEEKAKDYKQIKTIIVTAIITTLVNFATNALLALL